jgi:hypothetical protein
MIMASKVEADGTVDVSDADIVTFLALFKTAGHFRMSEGNYVTDAEYAELDR